MMHLEFLKASGALFCAREEANSDAVRRRRGSSASLGPADRQMRVLMMMAYSHTSERGSNRVLQHLFISLKSFPSTRPVKTTPTERHSWSKRVKEPINSGLLLKTRNTSTSPKPMSAEALGISISVLRISRWHVCAGEKVRVWACEGVYLQQVKTEELFRGNEIFQHISLAGVGTITLLAGCLFYRNPKDARRALIRSDCIVFYFLDFIPRCQKQNISQAVKVNG